jgi:uncharacterized protein (DUF2336 family)
MRDQQKARLQQIVPALVSETDKTVATRYEDVNAVTRNFSKRTAADNLASEAGEEKCLNTRSRRSSARLTNAGDPI